MPVISSYSLAPYSEKWKTDDLLHLLRRTLFGVGHKEVEFFRNKNLSQCLDALLTPTAPLKPPIQEDPDLTDPLVPVGVEWIKAPYENEMIDSKRSEALRSWWVSRIIDRDFSLTEKMILFWHNHFPIEMDIVKDARYDYTYYAMLRKHALGNYKKLIREGTVNPAMLVYLNGNSNRKQAPNENYGRELMELFTIGKGEEPRYLEDDVKAAARVLTGWKDDKQEVGSEFDPDQHDLGDKQFSTFFENMVIRGKQGEDGARETDELIEMIFQRAATADFFCKNIYRWLVCAQMDDQTERNIIKPLAQILIANNYEIIPVLRTLLGSEHFYDKAFRGCIEKSPVDFLVGAIRQFGVGFPGDISQNLLCSVIIHDFMGGLSMVIGNPPSVAGWPAYYQAPKYHRWWINPSSLSVRMELVDNLNSGVGLKCNGPYIKFDPLAFVRQFKDPGNVDLFIENCIELLYAVKVSDKTKSKLKSILLSGQESNYYWADAWKKYIANPNNEENRNIVEMRLRTFFKRMTNMVQYQMS
jgi:uncharacterized protein (DUF1800 family)